MWWLAMKQERLYFVEVFTYVIQAEHPQYHCGKIWQMFIFLIKNKVFSVYQPYQFVKNHITALVMGTQTVPETVAFNEFI
jgi:hypothetical protein